MIKYHIIISRHSTIKRSRAILFHLLKKINDKKSFYVRACQGITRSIYNWMASRAIHGILTLFQCIENN